jgi:hypothetical protein
MRSKIDARLGGEPTRKRFALENSALFAKSRTANRRGTEVANSRAAPRTD